MDERERQTETLERRLHEMYTARLGIPPATETLWQRVAPHMSATTTTQDLRRDETGDEQRGWETWESDHVGAVTGPHLEARRERARWKDAALGAAAVLLIAALAAVVFGQLAPGHGGVGGKGRATATATAQPAASPGVSPTPIQTLPTGGVLAHAAIDDVQMLSANDGWAVGDKRVSDMGLDGLMLHYTGGRWMEVPINPVDAGLNTISMDSPTDGWAGGSRMGTNGPALFHYTGGRWVWVPLSLPTNTPIFKIVMASANEGWAIQGVRDAQGIMRATFLHYADGTWTPVETSLEVTTLAMDSPTDGWTGGLHGVIAHYTNGRWVRWPAAAPGDVIAITMVSATDGWMTGVAPNQDYETTNKTPFILHFDGTSWRQVPLPGLPAVSEGQTLANGLSAISMTSASDGWAVGTLGGTQCVIYHYTNGAWQRIGFAVSEPLFGLSMVSPNEGWAVGGRQIVDNANENGVIVHYLNGQWSVYGG